MPGVFARREMEQVRRMTLREKSFLTGASGKSILAKEACRMEEFCGKSPEKPIAPEA